MKIMWKDAKYLLAFLIPFAALRGLALGGWHAWSTVLIAFLVIPILEVWLPQSSENEIPANESSRTSRRFFDFLLYLNVPLIWATLFLYLKKLTETDQILNLETLGWTLSTGLILGAMGINVGHELGHRNSKSEQFLAKTLLLPSLYLHFFIEHNRGHHKNVATDLDPASARLGENVYSFWLRSVWGSWISAWKIEAERLERKGQKAFSLGNEMLVFQIVQVAFLAAVFYFFGKTGLVGAVAVAVVGFLLLETVNYIEHYGLRRRLLPNGKYEAVEPRHSWNSDHELGRILLYELTRHSDHHFKSTRKYQVLRSHEAAPQLPFGYPGSILLALFPPVWFFLMDKRAVAAAGFFY